MFEDIVEITKILPCPFCGHEASVEEVESRASADPKAVRFSVGCDNVDEICMGYQSLTTFERRSDAVAAWNRRAPVAENKNAPVREDQGA
jgi:transcriptional regulator NrdR family protein